MTTKKTNISSLRAENSRLKKALDQAIKAKRFEEKLNDELGAQLNEIQEKTQENQGKPQADKKSEEKEEKSKGTPGKTNIPTKDRVLGLTDSNSFTECLGKDIWNKPDGSTGTAMVKGEKHRFLLQKPSDKKPFILIYNAQDKMVHDIFKQ